MASLPSSFSYFVSSLGGVSRRNVKCFPNNSTSVNQSEMITFVLPTDSICDLTSLQWIYKFKYQNASSNTNAIRYVPQPQALCRSVVWSLNGSAVSGQSNQHFAQSLELLRRSSCGADNALSRQDEYSDIPCANLIGAVTDKVRGSGNERCASNTVSRKCKMTNFLGLQSSPNSPNWDTSIFGETRIQIQLNGNEVCLMQSDEASADAGATDWQLTDIELRVDVISFASGEYDMLMSAMLQEGSLLVPFNELTTQKSLLNSSIRFNVASSSLDMVGFALLNENHTSATYIDTTSGNVHVSNFGGLSPEQVKFQYRNSSSAAADTLANMSDSVDATWYFTINGQVYPSSGATQLVDGAEYTKGVYALGKNDYNQLFMDYSSAALATAAGAALTQPTHPSVVNKEYAKQYKRVNYLNQNCFVALRTCLDVPAAESEKRTQSGINTLGQSSQIQLSLTGFNNSNDYALMIGQGSSILQVGAGQQIAVVG
jgi:hypothetical protein